jgi:hypothetical protein
MSFSFCAQIVGTPTTAPEPAIAPAIAAALVRNVRRVILRGRCPAVSSAIVLSPWFVSMEIMKDLADRANSVLKPSSLGICTRPRIFWNHRGAASLFFDSVYDVVDGFESNVVRQLTVVFVW